MNKSFRIADLVLVEGTSLNVDTATGRVTGFSRVTLLEGNTKLELDAVPDASDVPPSPTKKSLIAWDPKDVTLGNDSIRLKKNRAADIRFLWPNPLTPRSAGLFFRLTVHCDDLNKHRLRFEDNEASFEHGYALFRTKNQWVPFFLGKVGAKLMTPAEWRALWDNRAISEVDAEAIQQGALFSSDRASLLGNAPEGNDWTFTWRFGEGNLARALAVVQIKDQDFAVNSRALRLEERDDVRPRPLRWFRELTLQCASVRRDEGPAEQWAVDWIDVPTFDKETNKKHKDHFSFRSFWQELARHWPLGLRALRSQNSLTFLPTDIREIKSDAMGTAPWVFRFRCRSQGNAFTTDLATIGRHSETGLRFELGLLLNTSGERCIFESQSEPRSGDRKFEPITAVTDEGLAHLLHLELAASAIPRAGFLVGGLVFDVNGLKTGTLRIEWASVRTQLGQPPIEANVDLTFTVRSKSYSKR